MEELRYVLPQLQTYFNEFKLNKSWLAGQMGLTLNQFRYAEEFGFTDSQIELLEEVMQSMARDIEGFRFAREHEQN